MIGLMMSFLWICAIDIVSVVVHHLSHAVNFPKHNSNTMYDASFVFSVAFNLFEFDCTFCFSMYPFYSI